MKTGKIVSVNSQKGYGTIYVDGAAQQRYFFYFNRVVSGPMPYVGADVFFRVSIKRTKPGALPYATEIIVLADAAQEVKSAAGGAV